MAKRILAELLCVLLVVALLPKTALAAGEIDVNLADGDIVISGNGSPFDVHQIVSGQAVLKGSGALSDTPVRIASDPASATANRITVDVPGSSEASPVKITLSAVTINTDSRNALDIKLNTHVALTLEGMNTLTSNLDFAAVHVPKGAALTIQGGGTLRADPTKKIDTEPHPYGAAIGGNGPFGGNGEDCGSVTINSGTVFAAGGVSSAGIGGGSGGGGTGNGGSGGTVTINGGVVRVGGGGCASGIGGGGTYGSNTTGNGGAGGTVNIMGGTVYAWDGGNSTATNKRGAAIGGGGCYGSGSKGAAANITIGSFAYEWVYLGHVNDQGARNYSPSPWTGGGSNASGFVGIRPPLTISPASGTYGGPVSVAITSPAANIDFIKYTLDGSDPKTSPSARTYSAPFTVASSAQVKAYAQDRDPMPAGYQNNSAVVTAVYSLGAEGGAANVPKTGDDAPLMPLIGLVLLSGTGLAVLAAGKRRAAKRRYGG